MHVDDSTAAAASVAGAACAGAGAPAAGVPTPTPQSESTTPKPNVTFTIHPITLKDNTGKKKKLLEPCQGGGGCRCGGQRRRLQRCRPSDHVQEEHFVVCITKFGMRLSGTCRVKSDFPCR